MTMENHRPILAQVVAQPGVLRNSLLAYLRAMPSVDIASGVDGLKLAWERILACQPDVIIVDADRAEAEVLALVRRLGAEMTNVNCIVLANNISQQRLFLAAGARHVLLKGFLDERLREAVIGNSARQSNQVD